MKISDLQNGQTVRYRTGKAGERRHEYGEWKHGEIYLMRRAADLPSSLRKRTRFWRKEDLVTLRVPEWEADYGPEDYCGEGVFMAEEWCLQIEGLE